MDTDMLETAQKLATKIKDSDLYKKYNEAKKILENNPLLLERVRAYKKVQFELEAKRLKNGKVGFEEEKYVAHQYSQLSLHPITGDYLKHEYEFLNTYRQIIDVIYKGFAVVD